MNHYCLDMLKRGVLLSIVWLMLSHVSFAQLEFPRLNWEELRANKDYFLLGTLKHQHGDQRGKTPRTPNHVNTYYTGDKLHPVIQILFEKECPDLEFVEGENNVLALYSAKLNEKIDRYFSWEGDKGVLNEGVFENNMQRMDFIAGAFGMYGFLTQDTSLCQITLLADSEGVLFEKLFKEL